MKTGNASVDGQFTGLSPILFFLFVYQDGHGLRFDSKIFADGLSDVLHKRSFLFDRSPSSASTITIGIFILLSGLIGLEYSFHGFAFRALRADASFSANPLSRAI